jgi:uncharacterized membrane protein YhhN
MPFAWVAWIAVLVGAVHVVADFAGARRVASGAKALPIAALIAWVVLHEPVVGDSYRRLVAAGLLFSMAGDVFLLSRTRFREGVASFVLGHVFHMLAFTTASAFVPSWSAALVLVIFAAGMLGVLWAHVHKDRAAIACYVAMISVMAWTALGRAGAPGTPDPSGMLAGAGALLFMVSDSILAIDRFVTPWRTAHAAVMATYYPAQLLIAASVAA